MAPRYVLRVDCDWARVAHQGLISPVSICDSVRSSHKVRSPRVEEIALSAVPKRPPVTLTGKEQKTLLAQPNPRYPTGERNHLLLRLMLDTGLRLAEATGLEWANIDIATARLLVRQGKGAKDRVLWLGESLLECLGRWRKRQVRVCPSAPDHVFTTLQGQPLQHRYVQEMVRRYASRAGIVKRITPHVLRHTFATDLYRETGKIRLVQKALGHSDLSTTMIYAHVYDEEIESALKAFRGRDPSHAHDHAEGKALRSSQC